MRQIFRFYLCCNVILLLSAAPAFALALSFQPIYYKKGQVKLDAAGEAALSRVVDLLRNNPTASVSLEGHSSLSDEDAARRESQARADVALGAILLLTKQANIAPNRVEATAHGNSKLENAREPSSALNDRLEFVFSDSSDLQKAVKKGLETVKVIYWNTLYHSLLQLGVVKGTFEAEGFHVQLVATNHSSIDQVNAICGVVPFEQYATTVFAGGICGGSPHLAAAKGIDMVVIGGLLAGGSMLIAKPEMAAQLRASPKNFKGKRIGRPVGTSVTSMVLTVFLDKQGIKYKDIIWKDYPTHEAVIEGIIKGEVDAGDTYAPLHVRAKKDHGIVVVYNTIEMMPYHPCSRLVTVRANLKSKKDRDRYVRFLKGLINAHKFFIQRPREAVDLIVRYTGYSKEEVETILTPAFKLDPDPLLKGLKNFSTLLNATGYIESSAKMEDYVDNTLYWEALQTLVKENPKDPYYPFMVKQYERFNVEAEPKKIEPKAEAKSKPEGDQAKLTP